MASRALFLYFRPLIVNFCFLSKPRLLSKTSPNIDIAVSETDTPIQLAGSDFTAAVANARSQAADRSSRQLFCSRAALM